jgi:hypothetical protein
MKKPNSKTALRLTTQLGVALVGLSSLALCLGCKKDAQDDVEKAAQALAAEPSAAAEEAQRQIEEAKAQAEAAEEAAEQAAAAATQAAGVDSAAGAGLGEGAPIDSVAANPSSPPATPPPAAPRPAPPDERRGLAPTPAPRPTTPTPPPATPPRPDPDEGSSGDGKRTFKKRIGVSKKRLPGQD